MHKLILGAISALVFCAPVNAAQTIQLAIRATIPVVHVEAETIRYYNFDFSGPATVQAPDEGFAAGDSFSFESDIGEYIRFQRSYTGSATYLGNGVYRGDSITYLEGRGTYSIYGSTSRPFSVVQIAPAPVPEPATWALFLVGFGVLGAFMRAGRIRSLDLRSRRKLRAS